ncbi:MAG: cytochrome c3 family protein [Pseudomonadota bacterium]
MKKTLIGRMGSWRRGLAFSVLALGLLGMAPAQASITNTKHNLGSTGTGTNKFDGTGEICVFCHTPHGANTSAAVPLWNRTMASPTTYTTYNSLGTSSLDGATAPVGSVSLACLSCHDGTQAMNVMINTPGSGTAALAGTWTGANQTLGKIGPSTITNIGTDLKNDHPVGIQYGGGPKSGTVPDAGNAYDNTLFRDPDFKPTKSALLNGQPVWWVDTTAGTAGSREKTDMQLYTRTGADSVNRDGSINTGALTGAQPFVECASCHDPHTENVTFLRIDNTGSAVCLACHTK